MPLHKICKPVDVSSEAWHSYCLWRKFDFTSFDSLDSNIHNSIFKVEADDDWKYAVTNGIYLTDVVNDFAFAQQHGRRSGASEILIFDFVENEDSKRQILGYDILDGAFKYSLLTNFGNDIDIVNNCLGSNALIQRKDQACGVHQWFRDKMGEDNHVTGLRLFVVYEKYQESTAIQGGCVKD